MVIVSRARSVLLRVTVFVILVCASLIAIEGWNIWRARDLQLKETEIATANMAKALAQQAQDSIKGADTILVGLVERIEADGLGPASAERLHRLFQTHVGELPMLHGLFIYAADGSWEVASPVLFGTRGNNADRDYFIHHRDNPDRGPRVGGPLRSRTTGEWMIPVSRRINSADGTFAGVVLATIHLKHFQTFYDRFDVGSSGAIFLALDDGTMLYRRPFDEKAIGSNIVTGPIFTQYRTKGPVGTAMLVARVDGVERLYSYRHIEDYPVLVAAALSKQEILASWREDARKVVFVVLLVVAALAWIGLGLVRQLNVREKMEKELRATKSKLEELNQSLELFAMQDGLTGLANRRRFDSTFQNEFNRLARNGKSLALIMIDVDHFKRFNDIYGHPAGDHCLKKVGQAISTLQYRPGDLAARYGGEEFAVLLPETDLDGALVVAEKIRLAVCNMALSHLGNPTEIVTISAGIASLFPDRDSNDPFRLLQAADKALYAAKAEGRNRVCSDISLLQPDHVPHKLSVISKEEKTV